MGRQTWQRACPKVNHIKFKTNSRFKPFKVSKHAISSKFHKVQSSLKVQSSHNFQKWNTLTLGGAEVKYLPMTPEGAGVNPYMSFTISSIHKSQITSAAHLRHKFPNSKASMMCRDGELRHHKGGGMSGLNTQPCPRLSLLSWIANLPLC